MIDNFDLIEKHIMFLNERSMYYIPVIRRAKDNDGKYSDAIVRTYMVHSRKEFMNVRQSIIETCERKHARAYIKMNPLDSMSVLHKMAVDSIHAADNGKWSAISSIAASACGQCGVQRGVNKMYLIDLDGDDVSRIGEIRTFIEITSDKSLLENNRFFLEVPTRNGKHLITEGFNVNKFNEKYPKMFHDDCVTLLYYPESCI